MSRKMVVRFFCIGLTVMAVLAGCSKTNNGDQASSSASATPQPSASASQPESTSVEEEPVTLVMERPIWGNANPEGAPNVRIRNKIKENINVDVEIVGQVSPSDQAEKPNLMLAAGETMDIFQTPFLGSSNWRKYKNDDVIIPLNDLLDKYGQDFLANVNPLALQACTDEAGVIWCLPYEQNPVSTVLTIRQDWLDQAGLAVPNTLEEFENALQVFKDKFNDEGIVNFGIHPAPKDDLESVLAGSFIPTGDQNYVDADGKLKPFYTHPKYKDLLAKMAEWYKQGFIHKEYATMQLQQSLDVTDGGRSGLWAKWGFTETALQGNVPTASLTVLPPPVGPAGRTLSKGLPITVNVMITKSSKHPEAAMRFINYTMGTEEGWLLVRYGEEGYDWVRDEADPLLIKNTDRKDHEDRYAYPLFGSANLIKMENSFYRSLRIKQVNDFIQDPAQYPGSDPIDLLTTYDLTSMKSSDKINSLNTLIVQEKFKIMMGENPPSSWDDVLKKWYDNGGQQYIDDITEQFNAQN